MELTADLYVHIAVWGISLLLAYFLCTRLTKNVLTLSSFITFIITLLALVFSGDLLSWVMGPDRSVDGMHRMLFIQVTFTALTPSLVWFLITDRSDVTVPNAIALSKVLGYGPAAIVTIFSAYLSDNLLLFVLPALVCETMVYVLHVYRNNQINAATRYGNLNTYLRLDLTLELLWALLCITVPWLLAYLCTNEVDDVHIYLCRVHGSMTLGCACLSWIAPRFTSASSKRAVLCSRALMMLSMLIVTTTSYSLGNMADGHGGKLLLLVLLLMTLPSLLGSCRHDQDSAWEWPWHGLFIERMPTGAAQARGEGAKEVRKAPRRRSSRRSSRRRSSRRSNRRSSRRRIRLRRSRSRTHRGRSSRRRRRRT